MKVDYLISGAGAVGLAFLDVILSETDATVVIVDRRDAPGGHWNDAYPFVRLHQSSSFYGVCSKPMNPPRSATQPIDPGVLELSSKSEILNYYHDLMENTYLPSGRVTYFPMSEHLGDGQIKSLVSGKITHVDIGKKLVHAGRWGDMASIPSTHKRPFEVAVGVQCIAPNDLPQKAPGHDGFTVVGGGKTAMDAVVWLLKQGCDPDKITWVRPNDYWVFNREMIVNHPEYFESTIGSFQAELRAAGTATTVQEYCEMMEDSGIWHRIDPNVWPTKFHAAICSQAEIAALRRVKDVVRAGYVTRIEPDRLVLQDGEVAAARDQLYVDCTASGGVIFGEGAPPVFDGNVINLCMVRTFQPVFSAALIGFLEAKVPDDVARQNCTRMVDFHDTPAQYLTQMQKAMMNQAGSAQVPQVKDWMGTCRLYAMHHLLAGLRPDDSAKLALLDRFGPLSKAAAENIPRILANS